MQVIDDEALARKMVYGPKGEYDSHEIPGFMVRELLPYARALIQAEKALDDASDLIRDCTPALMLAALHVQATQEEAELGAARVDRIHSARAALRAVIGEP